MAELGGTYEAGNETMGDRSALPAGEYVAQIVKSEKKDAKKAGNAYINLEWQIDGGEHDGRRFWSMLNLWNSNSQAVEIAQRELNSICHAIGKLRVSDTADLHGIPMRVKLKVEKNDQYGDQNRIVLIKPLNDMGGSATSGGSSAGSGDADQSGPWKRSA